MKTISFFLLFFICCIANSAMHGRHQPTSLIEEWCGRDHYQRLFSDRDLSVGASREVIYAKEKDQTYLLNTRCVDSGLYLTMMRANQTVAKWWQQFAHEQWASLVQRCRSVSEKDRGMADALSKFKEKFVTNSFLSEEKFRERYKGSVFAQPEEESVEGWIVFASTVDPGSETFQHFDIEMFMSVSASPRLPLALHIGITRSMKYRGEKHSNLSVKLHKYAYQVLSTTPGHNMYQGARYIFVRPLRVMCDILLKALPEGTVSVGTKETLGNLGQEDLDKDTVNPKELELFQRNRKFLEAHPNASVFCAPIISYREGCIKIDSSKEGDVVPEYVLSKAMADFLEWTPGRCELEDFEKAFVIGEENPLTRPLGLVINATKAFSTA